MAYQKDIQSEWGRQLRGAGRSSLFGIGDYRANSIMYQDLIARQNRSDVSRAGADKARGAASGGTGSDAARTFQSRIEKGMANPGNITPPKLPDLTKPVYDYLDPRAQYEYQGGNPLQQSQAERDARTSRYDTDWRQREILKTTDPFAFAVMEPMFMGLNRGLIDNIGSPYVELERATIEAYGQVAYSPDQFDQLKSTYDAQYSQDLTDYNEALQTNTAQQQIGQKSQEEYEQFQKDKAGFEAGQAKVTDAAAASGKGGQAGGQVGQDVSTTNTSPGLAEIKRDDTIWI